MCTEAIIDQLEGAPYRTTVLRDLKALLEDEGADLDAVADASLKRITTLPAFTHAVGRHLLAKDSEVRLQRRQRQIAYQTGSSRCSAAMSQGPPETPPRQGMHRRRLCMCIANTVQNAVVPSRMIANRYAPNIRGRPPAANRRPKRSSSAACTATHANHTPRHCGHVSSPIYPRTSVVLLSCSKNAARGGGCSIRSGTQPGTASDHDVHAYSSRRSRSMAAAMRRQASCTPIGHCVYCASRRPPRRQLWRTASSRCRRMTAT